MTHLVLNILNRVSMSHVTHVFVGSRLRKSVGICCGRFGNHVTGRFSMLFPDIGYAANAGVVEVIPIYYSRLPFIRCAHLLPANLAADVLPSRKRSSLMGPIAMLFDSFGADQRSPVGATNTVSLSLSCPTFLPSLSPTPEVRER